MKTKHFVALNLVFAVGIGLFLSFIISPGVTGKVTANYVFTVTTAGLPAGYNEWVNIRESGAASSIKIYEGSPESGRLLRECSSSTCSYRDVRSRAGTYTFYIVFNGQYGEQTKTSGTYTFTVDTITQPNYAGVSEIGSLSSTDPVMKFTPRESVSKVRLIYKDSTGLATIGRTCEYTAASLDPCALYGTGMQNGDYSGYIVIEGSRGTLIDENSFRVSVSTTTTSTTTTVSTRVSEPPVSFYSLRKGWNLIGLNMQLSDPSASAIANTLKSWTGSNVIIQTFNAQAGQAKTYFTDSTKSIFNNLQNLETGKGYWVYVGNATTLSLQGTAFTSPQPLSLRRGWNLVSFPYLPAIYSASQLANILKSQTNGEVIIYAFDAQAGQARTHFTDSAKIIFNNLQALETGKGYWIKVEAPVTVTPG